jgi:hypothetical protein
MNKKNLVVYVIIGVILSVTVIVMIERSMKDMERPASQPAVTVIAPRQPAAVTPEHSAAPIADYELNKKTGAKQFLR